ENLKNAIKFGYGIRILNQDIIEVIIGFIISANNNIKRIMNTMQKIRQFGENRGEYYCFPSLKVLQTISVEQFKDMGAGYRAEYLVESIKVLAETNFDNIKKLDNQSLRKWLISLKGVGPKVADCIMLFGFSRCESFPVDTWIEKVYFDIFKQKKPREQMSKDLLLHYGELSGYAQQYLFYYKRSFVQK
ncbi:MAG: 8-oxoguanine DNA glycosylase, partial [Clostridia bacterium]|nr:8-oxoguanine DNA glycosylase [Clostridia bacterium]